MSTSQTVIFSTDDYIMPSTAGAPQFKFFFEIIKEGSIVGNLPIKHKQFSLIGRLEDLCDIFIDNPTVSRKHAILQFHHHDPLPSLYDLGSAQGTFVNKQKLPPKAYKKLDLFTNIKFGTSSRYYILRCPELEQQLNQQDEQQQNQFLKTLTHQNKILSKQQAKTKYLHLLENDPYFGGQLKSRKFQGHQPQQKETHKQYEGITWGIGDENQVYAYRNQKEFPIEPDVLRRLPGLDQTMLQKISQYEQKFRVYDEIEAELNELASRQKREFGLEEKLQNKKQKLEKKFVESLEALERAEDWIRVNIFGEENTANNIKKKKQKEADTFSDDEFYDRTLENKHGNKQEKTNGDQIHQRQVKESTVEDLWMLKNNFLAELARKKELIDLGESERLNKEGNAATHEEEDELEAFMQQNQENLQHQNQDIYEREMAQVESKLSLLKVKLLHFLSQKQLKRLQDQVLNPEKVKEAETKKQKKQQQQKQKLQNTLNQLEAQQKLRQQKRLKRQQLQKQCQDQYSEKVFDLYRQQYQEHQDEEAYDSEEDRPFKQRPNHNRPQEQQHMHPYKKIHLNQNNQEQNNQLRADHESDPSDFQEEVVDLTKNL